MHPVLDIDLDEFLFRRCRFVACALRQPHLHHLRQPMATMGTSDDLTADIATASSSKAIENDTINSLNTPPLEKAPGNMTPPLPKERTRRTTVNANSNTNVNSNSARARSRTPSAPAPLDPNALSKALFKEFEEGGRSRDITPGGSPSRKRQRVYGDR